MEDKISLQEILQNLKKHSGLIIAITLVSLIVSAVVTFFILTPQYQASTQILVNQAQNEEAQSSTADIESSRELISTYNVIITSPAILEPTINSTNFNGSVADLRSKITVSAEEESQIATVTVQDEDPERVVVLANTIGQTFEQNISNIMNVDNVSILSEAQTVDSENPVTPQPFLNLAIALFVGLITGICIAFLLEYLDKSIKTEQDIEKKLSLPVLGSVPNMQVNDIKENSRNKSFNKESRSNI